MSAEPAPAVHRAIVLPISREQAWEAITDADQLACWLADEVELDAREGGAARFAWADGTRRVGVVDELAERRRIAFRWRPEEGDGAGDRAGGGDGAEGAGDRAALPADEGGPLGDESLVELTLDEVEGGTRVSVFEVRTRVLEQGDVPLQPAGVPSAWTPRMAALSACAAVCWA
ncbi:SRPBCC family protein [Conexibacter arvalis]|uniref:Uncharacterized protein YndB with AHSA1/START domain n=1 Tax=Conexibacter arvalis TaxID=912552 RepID=A0A840IAQ3_9ACTN|nr:SRPBCC domain-containing protein [Conexibacter arvalis]MBB4661158.1 uncharacterized protein YndB with AHSA1/START domain [Conexibacter arvalis]